MVSPKHTLLVGTFLALSLTYSWMFLTWAGVLGPSAQALVLQQAANQKPRWKTIETRQVDSGATIPAATYVIFTLPTDIAPIERLVLFGQDSKRIRYWGFCFDQSYNPDRPTVTNLAFPGKMFLSEAERMWRRQRRSEDKLPYSIFQPPTRTQLDLETLSGRIRHQLERFKPGSRCFIMTQYPLSIGTDRDRDHVNIKIEREKKLDPKNPDTDADGLIDGFELALGTDPIRRDTDGDSLIDGIEDANRNGIFEAVETDPRTIDTDNDGLCDGDCRMHEDKKLCRDNAGYDCMILPVGTWRGEDRNLNGIVDKGETSPLKADTDGDGVHDEQEYFRCILAKGKDC